MSLTENQRQKIRQLLEKKIEVNFRIFVNVLSNGSQCFQ